MKYNLPPSAPGLPLLGSMLDFAKNPFDLFMKAQKQAQDGIFYQKALGLHTFIIYEPKLIEQVLVKNANLYLKNKYLKSMEEVFGEGLLTTDGEIWKRDRQDINPLFTRERIQNYIPTIALATASRFEKYYPDQELNISAEMKHTSLDIFTRTLLGESMGARFEKEFAQATAGCEEYINFVSSAPGYFFRKFPFPARIKFKKNLSLIDGIIENLVIRRRNTTTVNGDDLATRLIQVKRDSGEVLTPKKIRDQLITFFEAGHETSAIMLGFMIHLISHHPDVQFKLKEELERNLNPGPITNEDLEKLPYLKQVIQESLRYYPTSWMLGRDAKERDQFGRWDVPIGATVIIPTWALHRDPKYFEHPDRFWPERWTPEFSKNLPRTQFIPFGYGARMCIGFQFAMIELQMVLADFYRRFSTESLNQKNIGLKAVVTMQPTEPLRVRIKT